MFHFLLSLRDLKTNKNSNINPFSANVPLLYPLKTSENRRFSEVFRGFTSGRLVKNELICLYSDLRPLKSCISAFIENNNCNLQI